MAETAAHSSTKPRSRGHAEKNPGLHAQQWAKVKERYEKRYDHPLFHPRQHEYLAAFAKWVLTCPETAQGEPIRRTIEQIVRAVGPELGWQQGLGAKKAHQKYKHPVWRTLDRLIDIGYLVERRTYATKPNGEGEHITVYVSSEARRGSSVGRAHD